MRPQASFRRLVGSREGFTLVELLVVMAVASVLAAAVLVTFLSAIRTFATQDIRIQNQDQARLAMDQLTRYIRMATSSALNTSTQSDAIAVAQSTEIVFYADVNGDDLADKVRYYVSGNQLKMQSVAPQQSGSPPVWSYPAYPNNGIVVVGVKTGSTLFTYFRYKPPEESPVTEFGTLVQVAYGSTSPNVLKTITTVDVNLEITVTPQWQSPAPVRIASSVQIRQRYAWGL
jgi:prepilin-type N-terminal cleavage/methylation domain-containing protein